MIYRSRAPLRLSFAGGGTDVAPYRNERGGAVLNATIDKYAYASLRFSGRQTVVVQSLDYDTVVRYRFKERLLFNGSMDLVKAVLRRMRYKEQKKGLQFFLHGDAPPGSGLGSSSTMVVTLLGLFRHWKNLSVTDYELAELACEIERKDMKIAGGKQDQYAAVFGGINFIEFLGDKVVVTPLRIRHEIVNELQYLCLLCYTGRTRMSDKIIKKQVEGYRRKKRDVIRAMDELKATAIEMKNALLQGRLQDFGRLLHHGWQAKKKMAGSITNPEIDELYRVARRQGAIGGKITGAGGGGYMLFFCEFDKRHLVAKKLQELGAGVVDFAFERLGLQTWTVHSP